MRAEFREVGETGAQEATSRGSVKKRGSKFQGKGNSMCKGPEVGPAQGHFIPEIFFFCVWVLGYGRRDCGSLLWMVARQDTAPLGLV